MVRFGTAGIRGDVMESITPEVALAVGRAAGLRARAIDPGVPEFVVGRDGRITGGALVSAVEAGLASAGVTVRIAGRIPTPALAFASDGRHGAMITASHNPPTDNGIKLFCDGVPYSQSAEREIEERIETGPSTAPWNTWHSSEAIDITHRYRASVHAYATTIGAPLDGLPIAIDCGNGMGSLVTPQLLTGLDAMVTAVNANIDGHFSARASKPTHQSLRVFREFVADGPYSLGIAHDGDADRVVFLDNVGRIIHEDTVLAILAEYYVRSSAVPDPVVITTPNASGRIDERVDAASGRVIRTRLGGLHEEIRRIAERGDTETQIVFAAEPWKHIHPAYGTWIDGIVSAVVFARLVAADGMTALRNPVREPPSRKEAVACRDELKPAVMDFITESLLEQFPDWTDDRTDGIRLDKPDGSWILVRPSGTEPYIRIYCEGAKADGFTNTVREMVGDAIDRTESTR